MSVIPGFSSQRTNIFDPLSLDRWDPFDRCPFLKDIIGGGGSSSGGDVSSSGFARLPVDWKETAEAHVIKADIPGVTKEEVRVAAEEGRVLVISVERKDDEEGGGGDTWHRAERRRMRGGIRKFGRRLRMPENAKVEEAKAEIVNGVLTVTVPKSEEVKKPAVRTVEIISG